MSVECIVIIDEFLEAFSKKASCALWPTNNKRLESVRIRGAFVTQALL